MIDTNALLRRCKQFQELLGIDRAVVTKVLLSVEDELHLHTFREAQIRDDPLVRFHRRLQLYNEFFARSSLDVSLGDVGPGIGVVVSRPRISQVRT